MIVDYLNNIRNLDLDALFLKNQPHWVNKVNSVLILSVLM